MKFPLVDPDRIEMPVYDESIFYPERVLHDLGFTEDDINDLAEFMRWHITQRNRELEMKRLLNVLGARRDQLFRRRKTDLMRELQSLEQLSI